MPELVPVAHACRCFLFYYLWFVCLCGVWREIRSDSFSYSSRSPVSLVFAVEYDRPRWTSLVFILLAILWTSWRCGLVSVIDFGKRLAILASNMFLFCSLFLFLLSFNHAYLANFEITLGILYTYIYILILWFVVYNSGTSCRPHVSLTDFPLGCVQPVGEPHTGFLHSWQCFYSSISCDRYFWFPLSASITHLLLRFVCLFHESPSGVNHSHWTLSDHPGVGATPQSGSRPASPGCGFLASWQAVWVFAVVGSGAWGIWS